MRSCNHCCREKGISVTYFKCVCVCVCVCVCICSLSYPACSAHAQYCRLWPAQHYSIFPHYFINGTIFEKKKLLNTKCVFWFPMQFVSEISHSKKKWVIVGGLHVQYRHSCPPLMKLEFSGQFFESYSNIKFHENLFSGSRVVPCGRTDGRTDMKLIVGFRNFASV